MREEREYRGAEQPPGHQSTAGRNPPSYVPPSQRRREQPYAEPSRPAIEQQPAHGPNLHGGVQDDWQATPPPPGGAPPIGGSLAILGGAARPSRKRFGARKDTETRTRRASDRPGAHDPHSHPHQHTPGGAAPPRGSSTTALEGASPRRVGVPNAKTIEPVSTLKQGDRMEGESSGSAPPSGKKGHAGQSILLREEKKKKKPVAFCLTACCIIFWLLVICIGLAILVVYLLYRPQPPRLRVTTATLNAGSIDQLPPPHGGLVLNSDLYVLAAIYNPNTKIDVVLHYMQLNLYFHGRLIGTQAVWPPMHEEPGDSVLRSVHLVVSEVTMTREDVAVWENATTNGGPVAMQLVGRFHAQLNFGRWLPFRYWVYPTCTLWLNPPPGGALRRARCRH
ncbi:uncharacterized protein LOC133886165 [Phragmites australis]|uniref:uncharacterized protein LOC133886165 n=1 Tax=Phragmites australis TaxID=29695 RepID=UPI002D78D258|nr:uncharacterized protein LOC133886165 [Phragmites australis]